MRSRIEINTDKLWQHQIEAIDTCERYINYSISTPDDHRASLIKLPTGTGKSGIIAYIARLNKDINRVLILTPRVKLRNQLADDINKDFFLEMGWTQVSNDFRKVFEISASDEIKKIDDSYAGFIMTLQMFSGLRSEKVDIYNYLVQKIDLIMIDEGHYEPAILWSKAIRYASKPTILFTATPYRNDYRYFDIHRDFAFFRSYKEMVKEGIIRQVELENLGPRIDNAVEFVKLIKLLVEQFKDTNDTSGKNIKVIIKCEKYLTIQNLVSAFIEQDLKAIGIHDNFADSEHLKKNVPEDIEKLDITFWIHQYKLLEGVDDKQFQLLFIYDVIGNSRALVQQIGRIVRIHKDDKQKTCKVFYFEGDRCESSWDSFNQYELNNSDPQNIDFKLTEEQNIYYEMIGILKDRPIYSNKEFRKLFSIDSIDPHKDIAIEKRFYVFKKTEGFQYQDLFNALNTYFVNQGYIAYDYNIDFDAVRVIKSNVFLLVMVKDSSALINQYHIEWHMSSFAIVETDKRIYLTKSGIIDAKIEDFKSDTLVKLDPNELIGIIYEGLNYTQVKQVALMNTNIGLNSITGKTIDANSIVDALPAFDDYAQICTRMIGGGWNKTTSNNERYYMGLSTGRISNQNSVTINMDSFIKWIELVDSRFDVKSHQNRLLNRYAMSVDAPLSTKPLYILIDTQEFYFSDYEMHYLGKVIEIDEETKNIENGEFEIIIKNSPIVLKARVSYINGSFEFQSNSPEEIMLRNSIDSSLNKTLINYMNSHQNVRVITSDNHLVYYKGKFYNPQFNTGNGFSVNTHQLAHCFVTMKQLTMTREKENGSQYTPTDTTWHSNSLFGFIVDSAKKNVNGELAKLLGKATLMVCDDLAKETADFIVMDENKQKPKIIFIHAKTDDTKTVQCSASGIQTVCAQAMKNLKYISMFNEDDPQNYSSWTSKWNRTNINRQVIGSYTNSEDILSVYQSIIQNPKTDREVWIITTNTISLKHINNEMMNTNPKPWVLQAIYLLNMTMTATSSIGAKLRIFCNP